VTPRLGLTAVVGLAGAGLASVASAQVWGRAEVTDPVARVVEVRGADVSPVALPLALVALAGWGAVLVLRRCGRRVVAVVGLLAAVGVVVAVATRVGSVGETARGLVSGGGVRSDLTVTTTSWPWVAMVGAALTVVAFLAAYRGAPGWPEMSSRYDAPTDREDVRRDSDLWRALDEGRDPTT
jgi:uncharacterized membrane protein (TIGR02234 family)